MQNYKNLFDKNRPNTLHKLIHFPQYLMSI